MIKLLSCTAILLFSLTSVNAQNYCVQFSKEGKKTALIKEGRNISFVFNSSENWGKAKIVKITSDSLFLEQPITKKDILTERESNYNTKGYELSGFRMMAYNNTTKAVGKGSAVVIIFSLAALSGGADIFAIFLMMKRIGFKRNSLKIMLILMKVGKQKLFCVSNFKWEKP